MPTAWLIDLSRLTSRIGSRVLTGIDRVELAWCEHLLTLEQPVFGVVRTKLGHLFLDEVGLEIVANNARMGLAASGRHTLKLLRKHAIKRVARFSNLPRAMQFLPDGVAYLNLGHSNCTTRFHDAIQSVAGAKTYYMIHDTIPLDHPETQAKWAIRKHRRVLSIAALANGLIFPSCSAQESVLRHMTPPPGQTGIVAHLGPGLQSLPRHDPSEPATFLMLGSFDPRKGHDLIADIWEGFVADPPHAGIPRLVVIGTQGRLPIPAFARLKAKSLTDFVTILENADDNQAADILSKAHGVLLPTIAEGYGLPALEAINQGIPCILPPLDVFRDILGEIPIYVATSDGYLWRETIIELMDKEKQKAERARIDALVSQQALPQWETHFNTVLTTID